MPGEAIKVTCEEVNVLSAHVVLSSLKNTQSNCSVVLWAILLQYASDSRASGAAASWHPGLRAVGCLRTNQFSPCSPRFSQCLPRGLEMQDCLVGRRQHPSRPCGSRSHHRQYSHLLFTVRCRSCFLYHTYYRVWIPTYCRHMFRRLYSLCFWSVSCLDYPNLADYAFDLASRE